MKRLLAILSISLLLILTACQTQQSTEQQKETKLEYKPLLLVVENLDTKNWVDIKLYYNDIPLLETGQLYPNDPDYKSNPNTPNFRSYTPFVPTSNVILKAEVVTTGKIEEQTPKITQTIKLKDGSYTPNIDILYDGTKIEIKEFFTRAE